VRLWPDDTGTDDANTEQMRTVLRSYRGLLDRLVGV
jgi:hypothetical protein